MKSGKHYALNFLIVALLLVAFYLWFNQSLKQQTLKNYSKYKIQEALFTADCTIAVKIKDETLSLKTGYQDLGISCLDPKFIVKISPSGKYLAHVDIAGSAPQLRTFFTEKTKYPTSDVFLTFPPDTDYDFSLLPGDKLAVLTRATATIPAKLTVYDLPLSYKNYPNVFNTQTIVQEQNFPKSASTYWYVETVDKTSIRILDKNKVPLAQIKLN